MTNKEKVAQQARNQFAKALHLMNDTGQLHFVRDPEHLGAAVAPIKLLVHETNDGSKRIGFLSIVNGTVETMPVTLGTTRNHDVKALYKSEMVQGLIAQPQQASAD